MTRDCNLIVLLALVLVAWLMPIPKHTEPSVGTAGVAPSGMLTTPEQRADAGLFALLEDPPAGNPFPRTEADWRRYMMVADYLVAARDLLGLPETKALEIAADALWVFPGQPPRHWRPADGLGPILDKLP